MMSLEDFKTVTGLYVAARGGGVYWFETPEAILSIVTAEGGSHGLLWADLAYKVKEKLK